MLGVAVSLITGYISDISCDRESLDIVCLYAEYQRRVPVNLTSQINKLIIEEQQKYDTNRNEQIYIYTYRFIPVEYIYVSHCNIAGVRGKCRVKFNYCPRRPCG